MLWTQVSFAEFLGEGQSVLMRFSFISQISRCSKISSTS